jgi:predicted GNAT family N-acyltransferase
MHPAPVSQYVQSCGQETGKFRAAYSCIMSYTLFRAVSPADKQAIYRFRYQIYIEELGKTHIPADGDGKLMYDEADDHAVLFYAVAGDRLVATVRALSGVDGPFTDRDSAFLGIPGFARQFGHRKLAVIDRLIVDREWRKSGLAHEMMLATYLYGLEVGTRCGFISCEDQLLPLYLRYGFRACGEPVSLLSGEKRHRLVLFLCDRQYLEKTKSPFLPHLPEALDDKGAHAAMAPGLLNPAAG